MNYFDLYSSYPDRTIAAVWDSQIKEAETAPWLTEALTECGGELFTRFAAYYAELGRRGLAALRKSAISIIAIVFSSLAVVPAADAQAKGRRRSTLTARRHQKEMAPSARPYQQLQRRSTARARVLGGAKRAEIDVAGVCDQENLPIVLDVPVRLMGNKSGGTRVTASNVPANTTCPPPRLNPFCPVFFQIIEDAVEITHLVIDGGLDDMGSDNDHTPPAGRSGIWVIDVDDFVLTHLRIQGMGQAVRIEASKGQLKNSDLSALNGVFFSGGDDRARPTVAVSNNRILYRTNGILLGGGGNFGTALSAAFRDNEVVTTFTNTGDTNPAAFRVSPIVGSALDGDLEIVTSGNFFGGPAKYGIMIHAGNQVLLGESSYTGTVDARFADNIIDGATLHPALITFTNALATVLPAELNTKWEYLTNAKYTLRHDGELDGALIDHPQFQPVDGYLLGNVLRVNRAPIAHQTFVVVPQ